MSILQGGLEGLDLGQVIGTSPWGRSCSRTVVPHTRLTRIGSGLMQSLLSQGRHNTDERYRPRHGIVPPCVMVDCTWHVVQLNVDAFWRTDRRSWKKSGFGSIWPKIIIYQGAMTDRSI